MGTVLFLITLLLQGSYKRGVSKLLKILFFERRGSYTQGCQNFIFYAMEKNTLLKTRAGKDEVATVVNFKG